MSRTPNYDVHKLPKWVQQIIKDQDDVIDTLRLDLETAYGWVNNLEDTLEEINKYEHQCDSCSRQLESNGIPTNHG